MKKLWGQKRTHSCFSLLSPQKKAITSLNNQQHSSLIKYSYYLVVSKTKFLKHLSDICRVHAMRWLGPTSLRLLAAVIILLGNGESLKSDNTPNRASAYNPSNLKCQIGKRSNNVALKSFDFPYYYAMGTVGEIGAIGMFKLEQLLYTNIEDDMVWCWEESNDLVGKDKGGRRHAVERQFPRRAKVDPGKSRSLEIFTFTPGSADSITEYNCPPSVQNLFTATRSEHCKIVEGSMRIIAEASDDVSFAIASLRDGLESAMNNGLGQNGEIENLKFLSYLADNEEEVLALTTAGRPDNVIGQEISGSDGDVVEGDHTIKLGNGGKKDTIGTRNKSSDNEEEDNNTGVKLAASIGIPLVLLALIALLLKKKKQAVRIETTTYYDLKDRDYVLPGTGDPPGHFHNGLFHYMQNGQAYLSTNCEHCFETRKDLQYIDEIQGEESDLSHDGDLATILENETYDHSIESRSCDNILFRANSKQSLSQHHMGMDVHKCSSATCNRCTTNLAPVFVSEMKGSFIFSEV